MSDRIKPTPERLRHGEELVRASKQWIDSHDKIGDPYIVQLPLLLKLKANGTITVKQAQAGDRYHLDYMEAHGSQTPAQDLSRDLVDGARKLQAPRHSLAVLALTGARRALRGDGSHFPARQLNCADWMLGQGQAVSAWALQWSVTPMHAYRVLRKVLEVLEGHYETVDNAC